MKYIFALITCCVLAACGTEDPEPITPTLPADTTAKVELRFKPTMNGIPLVMNQVFTGPNGLRMQLELWKFYISEITLQNTSVTQLLKDVALFDFSRPDKSLILTAKPGLYTSLSFAIGVDRNLNRMGDASFSPAVYPMEHPLSIYNDMYWTNSTGYVFLRVEGKIDTSAAQNSVPEFTWFYHTGQDTMYTTTTFDNLNLSVVKGQTKVIELEVEVNELFRTASDTINMVQENFTHSTDRPLLARKVITNFKNAVRKI